MSASRIRSPWQQYNHGILEQPHQERHAARSGNRTRVLFVDDDPGIAATLPAILQAHEFDVTVASTVAEALTTINSNSFDVLISDLNIHQAADGFTVVNEMRRLRPEAVTIILTGFPAFASALKAIPINEHVDDFVLKPADIPGLVSNIQEKLQHRTRQRPILSKRLSAILLKNRDAIIDRWLDQVKKKPEFATITLSDDERICEWPDVLDELAVMMDSGGDGMSVNASQLASRYARRCQAQGYTIPMMLEEVRILQITIWGLVQGKLLEIDLNFIVPDLGHIAGGLNAHLQQSIQTFLPTGGQRASGLSR